MSWSSTDRGCRTTFPQISLRVCGSVRSTEMIWGETGGRVAHASTRCIPAAKSNSRPEMRLILTCQWKLKSSTENMFQQDPVSLIYCKYIVHKSIPVQVCTDWAWSLPHGTQVFSALAVIHLCLVLCCSISVWIQFQTFHSVFAVLFSDLCILR